MKQDFWSKFTFIAYYKWLRRKQGYRPATAWASCCQVFNQLDKLAVARDNKHHGERS